jgi:hypothetical protein
VIAEPDVALTDYGLAVEAGLFALAVRRRAGEGGLGRSWVAFFATVALGALLGGTVHGFLTRPTATAALAWRATLLALGGSALAAWSIGGHIALGPRPARWVRAGGAALWVGYALVVCLVTDAFAVAVVHYLPAALFLLGALAVGWWRTGARPLLAGALGTLVLLAGSAVPWLGLALPVVHLTPNALYHVVQAVALAMLFAAARWLPAGRR